MGSRAYILGFLTFSSYINFIFKNTKNMTPKEKAPQTAVEWLAETLKFSNKEIYAQTYYIIEQAKEMEKQQIIDAYEDGNYENGMGRCEAEQYYNEQFNK